MYGWRARIGLIVAHSNTTMEPSFNQLAPAGVSVHAARVRVRDASVDGLRDANSTLARAVEDLSEIDATVFAYACTAINFVSGSDEDRAQGQQIEQMTGRPAITAATAVLEALDALGVKCLAVGTPYVGDVNDTEQRFLEAEGFEVLSLGALPVTAERRTHDPLASTPVSPVGLQPPEVVYRLGRKVFEQGAEALFLSAANLRSLEMVAPLEADLGVPVVTSSQAIIWAALQLAGVREPIPGYGRLLEGPLPLLGKRRARRGLLATAATPA